MNQKLWYNLHDMFDTDDGSLPDIYLLNLSEAAVVNIWAYLRKLTPHLIGPATFWHRAKEESVSVDAVQNAAELVVNGEAESFHILLHGVSLNGVTIPDLGVFVFPDAIYLDYRMGKEWGAAELGALFELLYKLQSFDKNILVTLPPENTAEMKKRFATAFFEYRRTAEIYDGCGI